MTKQQLVAEIARRSDLNSGQAGRAIEAFVEIVTEQLTDGGDVNIPGFGKFTTQQRAARTGVNPRDPSQKVEIPAARVPKFAAGSALKTAVKQR
jgi:DNA-binding protein HU-beta